MGCTQGRGSQEFRGPALEQSGPWGSAALRVLQQDLARAAALTSEAPSRGRT